MWYFVLFSSFFLSFFDFTAFNRSISVQALVLATTTMTMKKTQITGFAEIFCKNIQQRKISAAKIAPLRRARTQKKKNKNEKVASNNAIFMSI